MPVKDVGPICRHC